MKTQTHTTNPTKRKPIDRSKVGITIVPDPKKECPGFFTVNYCELSDLKFPDEAKILLWAYTSYDESSWDMGTVGAPNKLIHERIEVWGSASKIQFRLDVYMEGDAKLLGQAEGIKPLDESNPDQLQSLFDTELLPLGNEIWRLALEEGQKPTLQLNDDDQLQASDFLDTNWVWRGLILPNAIRQTLMYLTNNPAEDDDPSLWQNKWKTWVKRETGDDIPDSGGEGIEEWVDRIVKKFVDGLNLKAMVLDELDVKVN
jgi:hypothetical protein